MADDPGKFDLNEIARAGKHASTHLFEPPAEAEAKRIEAAEKSKYKRKVHFVTLIFALFMVFLFAAGCVYEYVTGSVDDKKWAGAIVASICSAFLGFVVAQRLE
jgi:hypothetical protein